MARILICHVAKDAATARDLGAALMGRGHSVSFDGEPDTPRSDRAARLKQFEAVIVIWSEVSVVSPGIASVAAQALALNLLLVVRTEALEPARLPLQFRKLNSLIVSDVDGMTRLVTRLSTAASSLKEMQLREEQRREARRKGLPTDLEEARLREQERREKERLEAELIAMRRKERERLERERREGDIAQVQRKERERQEMLKLEAELAEARRKEFERKELERIEAEQNEAERREKERREQEELEARLAEAERQERERLERDRVEVELAEARRRELERERLEAERAEALRRERERQDEERVEALRLEVERRERERKEREWIEAQWIETQRRERERIEAQLLELQQRAARSPQRAVGSDWQPVGASHQGQDSAWVPAGARQPPVWELAEVGRDRAAPVMPPPLPPAVAEPAFPAAALALAPPPEPASGMVLFMHEVPSRMAVGEPELVRVCLGRGTISGFSRAFAARAGLDPDSHSLVETVSMSLYGRGDVFEIDRQSERVQLLPTNHLLESPLELSDYGRWVWHVTPLIHGEHELFLRVSALFRDRRGVPTPAALPDQKVDVVVSVATGASLIQSLSGWLRR